ncbi:hypothetical protein EZS27_001383 [termite gut metagenome]|uniref:Uncharacterized protein n=1 Tax=termite gut metagenome TaxID=433724 RepID=A0A5J4SYY9_9ZZZZ
MKEKRQKNVAEQRRNIATGKMFYNEDKKAKPNK